MLKQLYIRNFAVIEELDLSFGPGLTVFTGETGAGKSILIDALGLLLGDRADAKAVRGGADAAEITGTFDAPGGPLAGLLEERAIDVQGGELMVRRVVGSDGRSRAFLNGSPAPVQLLREVGEMLVDIHGQGDHQSLLKRDVQRQLLDEFGKLEQALETVREACVEWREMGKRIEALSGGSADRDAQLALLRYQVEEIEAEHPVADEFESLEQEHRRLANAATLIESVQQILASLDDADESAVSQLGSALRALRDMERYDPGLANSRTALESAAIQMAEGVADLRSRTAGLDLDPERLGQVERRLDALHALARKHRVTPRELPALATDLRSRLDALEGSSETIRELEARRGQALERYRAGASALHVGRGDAGARLAAALNRQVRELGMPAAIFQVEIRGGDNEAPQLHGDDQVEILVTVNPGQPPRPLNRVASGGELSRISLALQVIASGDRGTPTQIFDEVDAGIGGAVAEIVGSLLHRLARRRQIICVTHLAQVASQGDHHFQVDKSSSKNSTRTRVTSLQDTGRVDEIARMLGGVKISERTRAHAREMLQNKDTRHKS